MILYLDHVAVAVRDPRPAAKLWGEMLGGTLAQGMADWHGFGVIQFGYSRGGRVEIISPASDTGGFLPRYLDRHGEGLHHMTYIVDDLRREAKRFRTAGYRIVNEDYSDPIWMEAFISPGSASGVLIQLAQSSLDQEHQDLHWSGSSVNEVLELADQFRR
jgi:methylmalonyl-CoA/ethylmalonyl-CoA epimerase